jgi:hypothetical protein
MTRMGMGFWMFIRRSKRRLESRAGDRNEKDLQNGLHRSQSQVLG